MSNLIMGQLPSFWIAFGGVALIFVVCGIAVAIDRYKQSK